MKALEILLEEHRLIEKFLDVLHWANEKIKKGERPSAEFFQKATAFVHDFSDRSHHFKEEHIMFALLAKKKGGEIDSRIDSLRYQHDRGRNMIAAVKNALDGYSQGKEAETIVILNNISAYVSLIRHHIAKEDGIFYPMVEKEFSTEDHQALLNEFQKEETRRDGKSFEWGSKLLRDTQALL